MKIISVFGTRPEAIKMAPLVKLLQQKTNIEAKIAVTAQHREMLDQVLELFDIQPDYDLNIMRQGQTLADITSTVICGMGDVFAQEKPHLVLVHGDTTTTFAAALAAFYARIPCGHVEAGLRTGNKYAPYPEEINRCLTGVLADYHFAPTKTAQENLLAENIPAARIVVTGNTVIDALLQVVKKDCDLADYGLGAVDWQKDIILLTCHRRENWGYPMQQIFSAVAALVEKYAETEVVFPVHKNPLVRQEAEKYLSGHPRIHLIEPLDYLPFAKIMSRAKIVLTDSGGMQEEAPALGKPVLVLREVTERPEAILSGTAKLVGIEKDSIIKGVSVLLDDNNEYTKMAQAINPYGDGQASQKILEAIGNYFSLDIA
ncbi:MAG: non-hydrolyzing UDP-N-acetylglucosamine 2-epimerase [Bacillota bacterium]|jgi:UDP-N-acetylglucosamine 2-epimerase (non-hydrolysing)